jgi:ribose transport system permease protein
VVARGLAAPAAIMSGIQTVRAKTLIFALSGFGSGLAALMLVARMNSGAPSLADSLQLPTVAAVVVGGTAITGGVGGLNRTIVGALIIMVLRVGMAVIGIDAAYEQIVYGGIVILAVGLTIDRARILIVK